MAAITPQYVALGVGASGALVDVSSLVTGLDGVSRKYGQADPFRDANPGSGSFVLDNYDGRFTPDNTTAATAAGYSTTVTEGMQVCIQIGTRLTYGRVRVISPLSGPSWGRVRITFDDSLGAAARTYAGSLAEGIAVNSSPVATWLFDDTYAGSGAAQVADFSQGGATAFVDGFPGGPEKQLELTAAAASAYSFASVDGVPRVSLENYWRVPGPGGTGSIVSGAAVVLTPMNGSSFFEMYTDWWAQFGVGIQNQNLVWYNGATFAYETVMPITPAQPMAVWLGLVGSNWELHVNGTLMKSQAGPVVFGQQPPRMYIGNASYGDSQVRVSCFVGGVTTPINLAAGNSSSIVTQLAGVASMGGITITADANLSTAPLGTTSSGTALDMLNELARTEQGYLNSTTTGTLTSPTETVNFRARTRPTTVTASFDAVTELADSAAFIRDITNLASTVAVSGPNGSVRVSDNTLIERAGTKSDQESVALAIDSDLISWGTDRLQRGALTALRLASVAIDSITTPTDRSADLLALKLGDRIRITNLPSDVLGFTTWDGWIVGGAERHNPNQNRFEFSVAPVLPPVPVFNAARYAAGTSLSLSAGINSSVTSMSVDTTDARFTTDSADLPVDIVVDSEQMTVTAVSAATPQVFTVTRGVNGTTAASHSSGATVELASVVPTADASVVTNLITNPTPSGTTGWSVDSAGGGAFAVTTPGGRVRFTCTSATSSASRFKLGLSFTAALVSGDEFFLTVEVRTSVAETVHGRLNQYATNDGSGPATVIDGSSIALSPMTTTAVTMSGTVDPSVASTSPLIRVTTNFGVGDYIEFRRSLLKEGTASETWFSGSESAPPDPGMVTWGGIADASIAYRLTDGQVQPATFGF